MAVHASSTVEARAEVDLWVHRDAMGDLERGVTAVLEDVAGVREAETAAVSAVRPRATDIRVTATVEVVLTDQPADAGAVRETLEDGVGVFTAELAQVSPADA